MYFNAKTAWRLACEARTECRVRVHLPAILTTRDGTRRVMLEDLSAMGARIRGELPYRSGEEAVLQWSRFEAHGVVLWFEDGDCGLRFFEPVPADELLATRDLPERVEPPAERDLVRRTAAAFVKGCLRL